MTSSRIDFGNALLYNLPSSQLTKLQKLQNSAARLVTRSNKYSHITPVLEALHWLPVRERIIFKILLLVFHSIHGSAPFYNSSLFQWYPPAMSLRSSSSGLLVVPPAKRTWGDRALAHAGPSLWNELPHDIKESGSVESFKNNLKHTCFISQLIILLVLLECS